MSPRDHTYEVAAAHYEQALTEIGDTEPDPVMALTEAFLRVGGARMDAERDRFRTLDNVAGRHARGRK